MRFAAVGTTLARSSMSGGETLVRGRGSSRSRAGWPGGRRQDHRIRTLDARGLKQLDAAALPSGRIRQPGGGRPTGKRGRDADRRSAARCRTSDARQSDASAAVGVEEPRQARRCVVRAGPQDQRRQRQAIAADARLQSAEQPKGRRRLEASGSRRSVRQYQRQGWSSARPPGSPSFRSIRRRRSWSATIRTAARTIVPRAIRNV